MGKLRVLRWNEMIIAVKERVKMMVVDKSIGYHTARNSAWDGMNDSLPKLISLNSITGTHPFLYVKAVKQRQPRSFTTSHECTQRKFHGCVPVMVWKM